MSAARPHEPSRRAVLAGAGVLALSACTGSTGVVAPRPTRDQRLTARVVAEIRALAALYAAAAARHPGLQASLAPYAAEHRAHLRALTPLLFTEPAPSASGSRTASPSPSPEPVPAVPATAGATRAALVAAERSAARLRRAQCLAAGPELARLLASISASEAVHAALLG